ncbi:MAG: transposase [Polyangiaceae bacterium]
MRLIWAALERLDTTRFYESVAARVSGPGRPAIDPLILLCLWVYATSQGVGSARQIDRLCKSDNAYRWICGGVSVNYHSLSDFRVEHGEAVDDLMTQLLAVLVHKKVVTLQRVAQDGCIYPPERRLPGV